MKPNSYVPIGGKWGAADTYHMLESQQGQRKEKGLHADGEDAVGYVVGSGDLLYRETPDTGLLCIMKSDSADTRRR